MNSSLTLRPPRKGEAAQLAQVHITAWRQAYQGTLPDRFWEDEALAARVRMWTQVIADAGHRSCARVAELAGEVIGIAMAAEPRDDDVDAQTQLFLVYLLAQHYGSGAADALLIEVLGEQSASLWVFKSNPRAQAFYRKHGFIPDGAEKDLGEEENDEELRGICEIRMVRRALAAKQGN